jgi:hypothetical protein
VLFFTAFYQPHTHGFHHSFVFDCRLFGFMRTFRVDTTAAL